MSAARTINLAPNVDAIVARFLPDVVMISAAATRPEAETIRSVLAPLNVCLAACTSLDQLARIQRELTRALDALRDREYDYQVFDLTDGGDEPIGEFDTREEARGCVAFDGLRRWEIRHRGGVVDRSSL